MNQYFIDHPEMICGKMEMVSGPYGMRPTCQPDTSTTLEEQLQAAMGRLNATLVKTEPIILEQPGEISLFLQTRIYGITAMASVMIRFFPY